MAHRARKGHARSLPLAFRLASPHALHVFTTVGVGAAIRLDLAAGTDGSSRGECRTTRRKENLDGLAGACGQLHPSGPAQDLPLERRKLLARPLAHQPRQYRCRRIWHRARLLAGNG
jgi:hypothetical protein